MTFRRSENENKTGSVKTSSEVSITEICILTTDDIVSVSLFISISGPRVLLSLIVCPMQFMALDRYEITWVFVCVCACVRVCVSAKRFVYDSDHNFCPIFLKFGTWVRNVIVKTTFGGQVPRVNSPPFIPHKPLFGENLLLKPMDSVTAYILTTTKAIITKLDQHIKQIEL